ncbi:DedA family protein [Actinoplanes couchii]|uniref:Membrane protein n=1 Tax=Actinoplanes couchii TaxID=403638 RepID=A0ABQ3XKB7_9ACTN|nr:VTT domain-containing protein [Actinoplanes couchii]MDR6320543.1 membrane protein DedA with SNARE-associated domain [Actinoplanes couchii]GID58947.1 membrane protein [Actinoplanes couchii]
MVDHLMPLLSSPWLYVIVVVLVTVDGFLPVVPSEVVVISLGALSATGRPHLLLLGVAVVVGGVTGDRVTYLLGRRAGARFTGGRLAIARQKAEAALSRFGGAAILLGRFLPYGRTATGLVAGSAALPILRFGAASLVASIGWAIYSIGLGRLGGELFAHSPLLGAGCGILFGMSLAGVYAICEKRRASIRERELIRT